MKRGQWVNYFAGIACYYVRGVCVGMVSLSDGRWLTGCRDPKTSWLECVSSGVEHSHRWQAKRWVELQVSKL